jgi:hypothetical protein
MCVATIIIQMEAVCSSKTLASTCRPARRYGPEHNTDAFTAVITSNVNQNCHLFPTSGWSNTHTENFVRNKEQSCIWSKGEMPVTDAWCDQHNWQCDSRIDTCNATGTRNPPLDRTLSQLLPHKVGLDFSEKRGLCCAGKHWNAIRSKTTSAFERRNIRTDGRTLPPHHALRLQLRSYIDPRSIRLDYHPQEGIQLHSLPAYMGKVHRPSCCVLRVHSAVPERSTALNEGSLVKYLHVGKTILQPPASRDYKRHVQTKYCAQAARSNPMLYQTCTAIHHIDRPAADCVSRAVDLFLKRTGAVWKMSAARLSSGGRCPLRQVAHDGCHQLHTALLSSSTALLPLTARKSVIKTKQNHMRFATWLKLPAFYGNRRFITTFARCSHWTLSWAGWTQFTSSNSYLFKVLLNINPPCSAKRYTFQALRLECCLHLSSRPRGSSSLICSPQQPRMILVRRYRLRSSVLWRPVHLLVVTNVSEERTASIFRQQSIYSPQPQVLVFKISVRNSKA